MTSRRSSGSMRADSAVEPTKSENITVTWRRSALSWRLSRSLARPCGLMCLAGSATEFCDCAQKFPPVAERDAEIFQVLIVKLAEH